MTRNCTIAALGLPSLLIAGLFAQETRIVPIAPTTPVPPGATPLTPGTSIFPAVPVVPAPPSLMPPSIPNAVQPRIQYQTVIPAPPGHVARVPARETYTGPVKANLDDGTTLTGEIQADAPLDCVASFGPIAVPFNKIRGILWRELSEGQGPQALPATLMLEHNDTLTVTISCPAIKVKTSWGDANIELHHVRSLLLTTEKVRWAETPDGRHVLAPDSDAPPAPPLPQ